MTQRLRRRLASRSAGQALAEFALVLPLIVLLIFAAIDFGRAVYIYNTMANSARQGARVAAVNQRATSSDCDPLNRTNWSIKRCATLAAISIDVQSKDILIAYAPSDPTKDTCTTKLINPPCIASVTVQYDYTPLTPIIGDLIGTITLTSTSQMPVEAWYP